MPQCPTLASPMRAIAADIYLSANRRARIQAQFVTARAPRRTQTLAKSPRAVVNIGSRVTGAENRAGGERRLCMDLTDKLTGRPTTAFGASRSFPRTPANAS